MRFPTIPLLLAGLCTGLPLAHGERGTNCVPTKAQVILREKMAELDSAKTAGGATVQSDPASATPLSSEQDAKAREALRQKLDELENSQPAPTATQAQPPKTVPVQVIVPATAPAPVAQETVSTPVSRTGLTPEQEAKARETLRQQMESLQPPEPATPTVQAAPPPSQPAPAAKAAAVVVAPVPKPAAVAAPKTNAFPAVASTSLTPEQEAKAREALRQQMEASHPQPAPATVQTAPVVPSQPPVVTQAPEPELPSLTAAQNELAREALRRKMAELDAAAMPQPEPPLTPAPATLEVAMTPPPESPAPLPPSEKQGLERLAELTEHYREGLMTPHDYHQERAKIVQSLK